MLTSVNNRTFAPSKIWMFKFCFDLNWAITCAVIHVYTSYKMQICLISRIILYTIANVVS